MKEERRLKVKRKREKGKKIEETEKVTNPRVILQPVI